MLAKGGFQRPGVNQLGNPVEQVVLLDHVLGFEHRPRVHELPMQREALALEFRHIQRLGIVDQRQLALWLECLDELIQMLFGLGQAGHMSHVVQADAFEFFAQRLAVIQHMMRPQFVDPAFGLGPRGGADDFQRGQFARQLGQDRTHATGCANDQQAVGAFTFLLRDLQSLEQQFPGGDGCQRQRRRMGEAQGLGHVADDSLVHHVQLAVGTRPSQRTGIEHLVARLEQRDLAADGLHHTRHVPAQHLACTILRLDVLTDLGVHRVDGDGLDLDQ